MFDRRSEELIHRNRQLLAEAERIRLETREQRARAAGRRLRARLLRAVEHPRSPELFSENLRAPFRDSRAAAD